MFVCVYDCEINELVYFRIPYQHLSGGKCENLQLDSLSLEGFDPGTSFRRSENVVVRVIYVGFIN